MFPIPIILPLYFYLLIINHLIFPVVGNSAALNNFPIDGIAINCGSSGNSTAIDGRLWIGDIGSKSIIFSQASKGKLMSSTATVQPFPSDPVPYMTTRISRWQFTYTFRITPGQKLIRLHFYPTSYPGFERSKAFFTLKAGPYTLLSNFSASLTADALGLQFFTKEFCVNVEQNQPLILTFYPSSAESYAFVNGIEIVSVPTGLYHTNDGEPGALVLGKTYRLPIDKSIALEMVHRLNIGGDSILPKEDTGMFREWLDDSNYLLESSVFPVTTMGRVKYTKIPIYIAPQKVYQTSRSVVPEKQSYKTVNFTWKLHVDLGFRYLLRFHFCELDYEIKENGYTKFSIFINNQMAEAEADLIKWSGGNGVAVYSDYVAVMEGDRMEGQCDLLVSLYPHESHDYEWRAERINAILKALEVFKLSNHDNNLAGVNPVVPLVRVSTSLFPSPYKLVFACGVNTIATVVVLLLTALNIIVYQLSILGEKFGKKDVSSSSPSEGFCRCFSFAEIQSVTNNFDEEQVIGRGGFGNVYEGLIDNGATNVAIKRLNLESNQGAHEFWTEIKMLSKLRHTHLVSLIGYCNEGGEMILVYEYMERGTLADHLYKFKSNICHLTWEQRLNICIGAARGLEYLHRGTPQGVIHRDVKATNILLDKDWVAKISDFGLCKIGTASHSCTHVSTDVKGTFGYFDPEYFLTRRLTKKSDVFAFGVVLLEVLCGRPAVDAELEPEQHSLVLWAQHCIREEKLDQIIDPSLRNQISSHCLKVFVEVASKCLHNRPSERPTMADVVVSLESALVSAKYKEDVGFVEAKDKHINKNIQKDDYNSKGKAPLASTKVKYETSFAVVAKCVCFLLKKKDHVPNRGRLQQGGSPRFRQFSIDEILMAPNDSQEKMEIVKGCLTRAWIDNGTLEVVIRYLALDVMQAEINAQSQLQHPHIVSLIGYCNDVRKPMLLYKYMLNRSLRDHLYGMDRGYKSLPWLERLDICIGAARGLQYLHSGTRRTIIHGKINSNKILLDEKWVPKVSYFESSNMSMGGSGSSGTMEYLDPEYMYCLRLTEKSDVYSFGVVLLEVLCARKPFDSSLVEDQRFLVRWFISNVERKTIDEIIDPYLVGRISPECLGEFVKIAWHCLLDRGKERPSMVDVVGSLQFAQKLQQSWYDDLECWC